MANIVFDFLHNYETGERRESEPANAYQYDEGHVIEATLPTTVTSCEVHYWIRGQEKSAAYTPGSITVNDDGSCTVTCNVPNTYFETNGELRVYIVVTDGDASITTYEGFTHICQRSMPDDYVDDDPENEATRVLTEARAAAATATAAAETAQDVADSIPADYSAMSADVDTLKTDTSALKEETNQLKDGVTITESMLEKGGISQGSNSTYRQACRCRLIEIADYDMPVTMTVLGSNTTLSVTFYNSDGTYNRYEDVTSGSITVSANQKFRFYVDGRRGQSASEMSISDLFALIKIDQIAPGLYDLADDIDAINADLDVVENKIDNSGVPAYYFDENYIQSKTRTAQLASAVNGVSFGFVTDVHTGDSSRNSMRLAKYISDRTSAIPFMIFGGDVPETNTGTLDGLYEQAQWWQEMMAQYGKHNVYQCRGNHDYLTNLSDSSVNLTNGACYSYVMGNQPYDIVPSAEGKLSYYFDVPSSKVRFIVLDDYDVSSNDPNANFTSYAGLSPVQYHWFVDDALKADGYNIVIVTHQPLNLENDSTFSNNLKLLRDIITAFSAHEAFSGSWGATTINVDFSTYTSNLVCVLSGHKHIDYSSTANGFLTIGTTSDAVYSTDGYNRQIGTISECAFDIVSIDTTNKVIKCTRIGAGSDRTFSYT